MGQERFELWKIDTFLDWGDFEAWVRKTRRILVFHFFLSIREIISKCSLGGFISLHFRQ